MDTSTLHAILHAQMHPKLLTFQFLKTWTQQVFYQAFESQWGLNAPKTFDFPIPQNMDHFDQLSFDEWRFTKSAYCLHQPFSHIIYFLYIL